MPTTLTLKGQVTIPKHIRDALGLMPGAQLDFTVNSLGEVILQKAAANTASSKDRFELARGPNQMENKGFDEALEESSYAAVMDWAVLTRDRSKYETYFPVVRLIAP